MAGFRGMTRRSVLAALAGPVAARAAARPRLYPSERVRYSDPATEFWVLRLTSPDHSSFLPRPPLRAVTRRRTYLIYANDRTGSLQLFRMLSTTGDSRQLTDSADLDPASFTLTPDDRGVLYFDGPALHHLPFATLREREVYRVPEGWRRAPGFSISPDGAAACLAETDGAAYRLRLIQLGKPAEPVAFLESREPLADPQPRPRHDDLLCRRGREAIWITGAAGKDARPLPLAAGSALQLYWTADGERIVYLNRPAEPRQLSSVREFALAAGLDRLVARTSQFACFSPNGDASVFVGASASKASPHILLLLGSTSRELTLCEHKSSDPARAFPVFSLDSQRVYFQSDHHGKPAIYSISVERLVERTE
jgi:oligogalacturonide lyase